MKGFSFSAGVTSLNVVEFHGTVDLTALHLLTGKGYIVVPGGKESEWLKALADVFAKAEEAQPPSPADLLADLTRRLQAVHDATRPITRPDLFDHEPTAKALNEMHVDLYAAFDLARRIGEAIKTGEAER